MGDRLSLAEASLTRLAEARGDITQEVLATYYRSMPDAKASFEHHGMGYTAELEGRMVGEIAFLLLRWAEDPSIAKIEQGTTIVHHQDTLEIGPHWYMGMIDAFLLELFATLPENASNERELWRTIRAEIAEFIQSVRCEFWRKDDGKPLAEFDQDHKEPAANNPANRSQRSQ